ncbi:hypothetical protein SEEMEL47_19197 [Salmonella enterica subsp. enterica serovar Meleagridis]|nr:hypothetical protein SEEACDC1_13305 [Salmonella enterica subsp. enterica serovar Agona str. SA-1]ESF56253.1 hypothetical protein SEES2008_21663 [Salmonella enterica subsp. enterica serovar Saintpaul str. JO2008]ESG21051.1 hypothetical protein SEEMEL47_19197 [Salmonella enterica subsp. enterica serovar Meleagridis str. 0047]ESO44124.1 hypothetical protein SEEA8691_06881 [Salmonella enterica subsp. enterica serovar Agona str. 392869-1]ESO52256.1 hypothetical protein SEEA1981_01289 [Salmonella 
MAEKTRQSGGPLNPMVSGWHNAAIRHPAFIWR